MPYQHAERLSAPDEVPVMNKSRALSLFAASMYSIFVITGCNVPMDENDQAGAGEGVLAEVEQQICDPKYATHGQMWDLDSAMAQYTYFQGWCSVGTSRPPLCFQGTYYYNQYLVHMYAWSVGSSGSFYDPDAWWLVTCNSLIDCIYDCSGQCVRASC
jgi:hypothetical protein